MTCHQQVETAFATCLETILSSHFLLPSSACSGEDRRYSPSSSSHERRQQDFGHIASPGQHEGSKRCTESAAPISAEDVTAALVRARRRLERLRRFYHAGRHCDAVAQAKRVRAAADAAGCTQLAAAAARAVRLTAARRYLPVAAVDEVELQLDAAAALWSSCRCVV